MTVYCGGGGGEGDGEGGRVLRGLEGGGGLGFCRRLWTVTVWETGGWWG